MSGAAAAAANWKSSTMTAEPAGSFAASLASDAVTSADIRRSIASRPAASAPNPGSIARGASMNPAQNRTASASARSHDNQDVMPGGRAAAQSASSTVLPAPADPTTTVSRRPDPAASRSCSTDLVTSVAGGAGGRNFASANREPRKEPRPVVAPSAINSWFPGPQTGPIICALLLRSLSCRRESEDRDAQTYWTTAPRAGHHPPQGIWAVPAAP